jgi:hypothetical protein
MYFPQLPTRYLIPSVRNIFRWVFKKCCISPFHAGLPVLNVWLPSIRLSFYLIVNLIRTGPIAFQTAHCQHPPPPLWIVLVVHKFYSDCYLLTSFTELLQFFCAFHWFSHPIPHISGYRPLYPPAHSVSGEAMLKCLTTVATQKGILPNYFQMKEGLYPSLLFLFCQRLCNLTSPVFSS